MPTDEQLDKIGIAMMVATIIFLAVLFIWDDSPSPYLSEEPYVNVISTTTTIGD